MLMRIVILIVGLGMAQPGFCEISKFSDPLSERKTVYAPMSGQWETMTGEIVDINRREGTFQVKNRKGEKTDFTYGDLIYVYKSGRRITFMDMHVSDDVLVKYLSQKTAPAQ